jgi:uncharacterized lipoprotein YddW (UPF0748 family)
MKRRMKSFACLGALLLSVFFPLSSLRAQDESKFRVYAVWSHPGFFGSNEKEATAKMQATLDEYVRAGINTVIMLVKNTSGVVYYPSRLGPQDPNWAWDFFGVFLREAQKREISVHPWFCVFPESGVLGQIGQHPQWLIRSPENEMIGAVNPALPEVRAYEIGLMMEVLSRYPVDWVHLDYIRFPSSPREVYFSWDGRTRALFKEYSGVDPAGMKARDSGNIMWNEWIEWNGSRVTAFVRELKDSLKSLGRPVRVSAAVFPAADKAKILIGQDWEAWAREGLIDMLCPMLYTNHAGFFEKYAGQAIASGKGHCLVCPGIGIGTSHNQNTPEGMWEQVRISRSLGGDGVVFFSSSSLTSDFLKTLKEARRLPPAVNKSLF